MWIFNYKVANFYSTSDIYLGTNLLKVSYSITVTDTTFWLHEILSVLHCYCNMYLVIVEKSHK